MFDKGITVHPWLQAIGNDMGRTDFFLVKQTILFKNRSNSSSIHVPTAAATATATSSLVTSR
jgi:hypothetical protein